MALEIERRWLLKNIPDKIKGLQWTDEILIEQHYLKEGNEVVRYRRITTNSLTKENKLQKNKTYFKTTKKQLEVGVFEENEEEISERRFKKKFQSIQTPFKSIIKKRYVYYDKKNKLKYEFDRYKNLTLIILEIELKSIKQKIILPKEVEVEVIKELTGDKNFSNQNLAIPNIYWKE